MTTDSSYFSRRITLIFLLIPVLILAGCALWLGLRVPVNHPKTFAPSNPLPDLHGQAAVEHLKQEGLYDSLADAVAAARYNAEPLSSPDAYQFSNPTHALRATFTPSGARIVSLPGGRDRELTIKLIGYGYGSRMTGLHSRNIIALRNRIEHEYSLQKESAIPESQSAIIEWFVNSEAGIEHGFTLPEPTPTERGGDEALRVEMKIDGDFVPRLDAGRQAVSFACGRGGGLTYDKLRVYDARNRELAARFELDGRRLAIVVEDGEAEYPVTIDPQLAQESKLIASDGASLDQFGSSVAISGDTVVVGAPFANVNETTFGAVYIFVRVATTWVQQAKLTAMNSAAFGFFGRSVAIDGNTVVVGAPLGSFDIDLGTAYVFERSGTTWTQQAILTPRTEEFFVTFGVSVAIDGDTVVVGAEFNNTGGVPDTGKGAAFVFVRSGMTWPEQAKLMANDGAFLDLFGSSVAIDGDTLVVGAIGADINTNENQGAAYVFARSGTSWSQQAKLMASDGASGDFFGISVAISGDTVAVGASLDDSLRGSAYVFTGSGTAWSQQQKLIARDGASDDFFGSSVAISGDTVMVGAPGADITPNIDQGAAYVFARSGTAWSEQQKLTASDGASSDLFGSSVAIIGDTKVAGASGANSNQGSAYVFMTPVAPGAFVTVSAASYTSAVAPKEIVAGFGASLAATIDFASSLPLPTVLGRMNVIVEDSAGDERPAPLYFVSPSQFNYQIPDGTAPGVAKVSVLIGLDLVAVGFAQIETTAPSIFTLNASGSGAAAALDALTFARAPFNATRAGGLPNIIAVWGTGLGADATDVDGNFAASVLASIGGRSAPVTYAGRAPGFQGANQFNIQLPDGITPGEHMLTISRGGVPSNAVTIAIR